MSPAGRALRKFPHNTPLELVGDIYVRKLLGRKPQAVIDVTFENHPVAAVPIEVVGELIPGSRFKDKKRTSAQSHTKRTFVVKNVSDAFSDEAGQHWHRIDGDRGESFLVRSLELARVLFFHSPHLVRSALRPNGLNGLAQVKQGGREIDIQFSDLSDFPASQLNNKKIQQHLAWLFLSDSARESFASILHQWQQEDGERWQFRFSPPLMNGWSLTVSAPEDENKNIMEQVTEIRSVDVSDFWVEKVIFFDHPKLKRRVKIDGHKSGSRRRPPKDENPKLDLPSAPGFGTALHDVDDTGLSFNISVGVRTEIQSGQPALSGDGEQDTDFEPQSAGAGSADAEGQAQELNLRLNQSPQEEEP